MRAMCGVQQKDRKLVKNLMLMLGWNPAIDLCSLVWSSVKERGCSCLEKVIGI